MTRRKFKAPKTTLFILLLAASLVVFFIPREYTNAVNYTFVRLFKGILSLEYKPQKTIGADELAANYVAKTEYDKLKAQYFNLLADLKAAHAKYETLAQIRTGLPRPGPGWVLASVVHTRTDSLRRELIINRGQTDLLAAGQYVLNADAFIGTVSETGSYSATVRLVTDAAFSTEVLVSRSSRDKYIRAQLSGDGKNACRLNLLPWETDVKKGDMVYAAASAAFLETPRIIGEVSSVKIDEEKPLVLDIAVEPLFQANKITDVAVIVMQP